MAPVEFTVSYGDGRSTGLLRRPVRPLIADRRRQPGRLEPASVRAVHRGRRCPVRGAGPAPFPVARGSLRDLADVPGDVVALHHTRSWDSEPVVAAVRALGRPVVLFTAAHTWVSGLDASSVLIGWSAPYVVVGVPRGSGERPGRGPVLGSSASGSGAAARPTPPARASNPGRRRPSFARSPRGRVARRDRAASRGRCGPVPTTRCGYASVPRHRAAGDELALRAVLSMDGLRASESFVLPGTTQSVGELRGHHAVRGHAWTGELIIYHGVVPVHVQQVVLPVGVGGSPGRRCRGEAHPTFADLGPPRRGWRRSWCSGDRALVLAGGLPSGQPGRRRRPVAVARTCGSRWIPGTARTSRPSARISRSSPGRVRRCTRLFGDLGLADRRPAGRAGDRSSGRADGGVCPVTVRCRGR